MLDVTNINEFPKEIFTNIFSNLEVKDFPSTSRVNKLWMCQSIKFIEERELPIIINFTTCLGKNLNAEPSLLQKVIQMGSDAKIHKSASLIEIRSSIYRIKEEILSLIIKYIPLAEINRVQESFKNVIKPIFFEDFFQITEFFFRIFLAKNKPTEIKNPELSECCQNLVRCGLLNNGIENTKLINGSTAQNNLFKEIFKILLKKRAIDKAIEMVENSTFDKSFICNQCKDLIKEGDFYIAFKIAEKGLKGSIYYKAEFAEICKDLVAKIINNNTLLKCFIMDMFVIFTEKGTIDYFMEIAAHITELSFSGSLILQHMSIAFIAKGDINNAIKIAIKIPRLASKAFVFQEIAKNLMANEGLDNVIKVARTLDKAERELFIQSTFVILIEKEDFYNATKFIHIESCYSINYYKNRYTICKPEIIFISPLAYAFKMLTEYWMSYLDENCTVFSPPKKEYLDQVIDIAKTLPNEKKTGFSLRRICIDLTKTGNFEKAIDLAKTISAFFKRKLTFKLIVSELIKRDSIIKAIEIAGSLPSDVRDEVLSYISKILLMEKNINKAVEAAIIVQNVKKRKAIYRHIFKSLILADKIDQALQITETKIPDSDKNFCFSIISKASFKAGNLGTAIKIAKTISDPIEANSVFQYIIDRLKKWGDMDTAAKIEQHKSEIII